MKKLLSVIFGTAVVFSANSEIRTITITPETFAYDKSVLATTKQQLSYQEDGFAVSAYCGIRSSVIPQRFVFAGKALTTNGAFLAITQNANNYKIINFEIEIGVKSTTSMQGLYTVRATDSTPSSPEENRINASEWAEYGSGATDIVGSRSYDILPGMPYAGIFSNGLFSGEFNSFTITYDTGSNKPVNPGEKVEPTLYFTQKALTYGTNASDVDLNRYVYNPENLPLTWSVVPDNGGVVISEGSLTCKTSGSYTLSAFYAGNEDYFEKEISIKLTVEENLPDIVGEVVPIKTSPDDFAQLYITSPLSEASITFPALGDYGIEAIDRRNDNFITVMKEDEVIQKIPTTDRSVIYIDRNDYNKLWVKFDPISEKGNYKIKFPANLATIDIYQRGVVNSRPGSATMTDLDLSGDFVKTHSAPYTLNIIILNDLTTGVDSVVVNDETVRWYDLQGNKILNPLKGVFIMERDGKFSKVIIR